MQICCPQCQHCREVDESKIPERAQVATCPKCQCRFHFREQSVAPQKELSATQNSEEQSAPNANAEQLPKAASFTANNSITAPENTAQHPTAAEDSDIWAKIATLGSDAQKSTAENEDAGNSDAQNTDVAQKSPSSSSPFAAPKMTDENEQISEQISGQINHPANDPAETEREAKWQAFVQMTKEKKAAAKAQDAARSAESMPQEPASKDATLEEVTSEEFHASAPDHTDHSAEENTERVQSPNDANAKFTAQKNQGENSAEALPTLDELLSQAENQDIPWEWPREYGTARAFFETARRVIFSPVRFFTTMRPGFSILTPVAFYILMGIFEEVVSRAWMLGISRYFFAQDNEQINDFMSKMSEDMTDPSLLLLSLAMLFVKLAMYLGLFHSFLRFLKADHGGVAVTLRVICYANAVSLLAIVPFFGQFVVPAWYLLLICVGIKAGHKIPWGKAFLATLPVYLIIAIMLSTFARSLFAAGAGM